MSQSRNDRRQLTQPGASNLNLSSLSRTNQTLQSSGFTAPLHSSMKLPGMGGNLGGHKTRAYDVNFDELEEDNESSVSSAHNTTILGPGPAASGALQENINSPGNLSNYPVVPYGEFYPSRHTSTEHLELSTSVDPGIENPRVIVSNPNPRPSRNEEVPVAPTSSASSTLRTRFDIPLSSHERYSTSQGNTSIPNSGGGSGSNAYSQHQSTANSQHQGTANTGGGPRDPASAGTNRRRVATGHPGDPNDPDNSGSDDDRFPPRRGFGRDRDRERDRDRDDRARREREGRLQDDR